MNRTADIKRHIDQSLAGKDIRPPAMSFWHVRPVVGPERPTREIDQPETDLLLRVGATDLLAELDMCFGRHSSIVSALAEYKARHQALFELLPPPVAITGLTFTHDVAAVEHAKALPYAVMLDGLLASITQLVDINLERCAVALTIYDQEVRGVFGKPLLGFTPDPAGESGGDGLRHSARLRCRCTR